MKKIIYDFGANNGDDIPYYLLKGSVVIAVEANPSLCELIEERFISEIKSGRLVVVNAVLADKVEDSDVDFYIHREDHVLSQFPKPEVAMESFRVVQLPSVTPAELISKYGDPFYIKIDIEHFDAQILRSLFDNEIFPPFISAECHSADVFSILVTIGGYDAFKIIDGKSVPNIYKSRQITLADGGVQFYSFPKHSAGSFGAEVDGEWLNGVCMLRQLGVHGCGWRDIHASRSDKGLESYSLRQAFMDVIVPKFFTRVKSLLK